MSEPLIRSVEKKVTVEDIRRNIRHKSAAIAEFMNNPIGKAVVAALEETFYDGELFDPDPHQTAYNLGRRDVVSYMKQLQRIKDNDDGTGIT
jgi:hypothetical protein